VYPRCNEIDQLESQDCTVSVNFFKELMLSEATRGCTLCLVVVIISYETEAEREG
jgi:hypothetical protein